MTDTSTFPLDLPTLAALPGAQWSLVLGILSCVLGLDPDALDSTTPGSVAIPCDELFDVHTIGLDWTDGQPERLAGVSLVFNNMPRDTFEASFTGLDRAAPGIVCIGTWSAASMDEFGSMNEVGFLLGDAFAVSLSVSTGEYCDDESDATVCLDLVLGDHEACESWIMFRARRFLVQCACEQAEQLSSFPRALRDEYLDVLEEAHATADDIEEEVA